MAGDELISRVRNKDKQAFISLMNTHGVALDKRLLERLGNSKAADRAFQKISEEFYHLLYESEGEDFADILLYEIADKVVESMSQDRGSPLSEGGRKSCSEAVNTVPEIPRITFQKQLADPSAPEAPHISNEEVCRAGSSAGHGNSGDSAPSSAKDRHNNSSLPDPPAISSGADVKKNRRFSLSSFLLIMLIVLLSVGILAVLWTITGLMMDMGLIPEYDLGYSWFNINIAPWF